MKKISSKLIALLLTAEVFITLSADFTASAIAYSGTLDTGLYWDFDYDDRTLTISGRGEMDEWYDEMEDVLYARPWEELLDYIYTVKICDGVTSIGGGAFTGCEYLTSVIIPSSTVRIGHLSFYGCTELASVSIPSSVISFGFDAFFGCEKLKYNTYDNAKYLGNADNLYHVLVEAKNTTITSCTVNKKTKCIASCAFFDCSKLTKVSISSGLQSICSYAFLDCSKLASIKVPDTLTTVELDAFLGSGIKLNSYDNASYIGNDKNPYHILVEAKDTDITKCTVNSKTKHIAEGAFLACVSLESISLPSSVVSVGAGAFSLCAGLKTVKMPEVTSIGGAAFTGCILLSSLEMPKVTEFGPYAFSLCVSLKSVTVSEGTTVLETGTFAGCGITSVTLPGSVKSIFDGAFDGCESLNTVNYGGTISQKRKLYVAGNNANLNSSTWVFTQCSEGHTFENKCDFDCDICGYERIAPHKCTEVWKKNSEMHWHECTLCRAWVDAEAHVYDGEDDKICNICGYDKDAKYIVGDVDQNGTVDADDAIYLLYYTFFPEDYLVDQPADFDQSGTVDADDAIYLLYHTFFPEDYPIA